MTDLFSTMGIMNERITIKCSRSIEFVKVKYILHIEAQRAYCKLHILNEKPLLLSCPLKKMVERLSGYPIFLKCHKSHLINMLYVKSYHSDNGIRLIDNSYIPLSINKKPTFLEKMEELFKES